MGRYSLGQTRLEGSEAQSDKRSQEGTVYFSLPSARSAYKIVICASALG